jgi:hypothetical protein
MIYKRPETLSPAVRKILDEFVAERCEQEPYAHCGSTALFQAFSSFLADRYPRAKVTHAKLGGYLTAYGLQKRRRNGGYVYLGIRLT